MKIQMVNSAGVLKEAKLGFSWTMFFFGPLVPLVRGDMKWFLIGLLISILTSGLAWLVFPFVYNKIYLKELLEKGYAPVNEYDQQALVELGILAAA